MKYCPSCLSQYTDLTLKFCLQDGTPLSAAPPKQNTIDTVAFAMPVTEQNLSPTRDYRASAGGSGQTVENVRLPATPKRSPRKAVIAAAVILPLTALAAVGGAAGWVYLSGRNAEAAAETATKEDTTATRSMNVPTAEVIKASDKVETHASEDGESVKAEIADLIERWKDLAEGRNADPLSAMYGEKVDYLGRPGTTPSEIRAELKKTFDSYSEIDLEISNLLVAVDAEGNSATALFDKEWSHEAPPKLSEGKAHYKLHLQKDPGGWKIVTEKQLKVYFTQN